MNMFPLIKPHVHDARPSWQTLQTSRSHACDRFELAQMTMVDAVCVHISKSRMAGACLHSLNHLQWNAYISGTAIVCTATLPVFVRLV